MLARSGMMAILLLTLAACGTAQNDRLLSGGAIGAGAGAVGGAFLGAPAIGAAIGGAAGAAIGGLVGADKMNLGKPVWVQ